MAATFKRSNTTTNIAAAEGAAAAKPLTPRGTAVVGQFEQAASFLNLALPKKGGGSAKLGKGGIPLRLSAEAEAMLHDYFAAAKNPEELAQKLENVKSKLILTWNPTSVATGEKLELDL